jgi:hypothetical protein
MTASLSMTASLPIAASSAIAASRPFVPSPSLTDSRQYRTEKLTGSRTFIALGQFVLSQSFSPSPTISASPSPSAVTSDGPPVIVNATFARGSAAGTFIVVFGLATLFLVIVRRCYVYEAANHLRIEL